MSTFANVAGSASLPALSVQSPVLVTDWSEPSSVSVTSGTVSVATPLSVSAQLNATPTLWFVQVPAVYADAPGGDVAVAARVGAVLSMSMSAKLVDAASFPASSVQSPVLETLWLAPSAITVTSETLSVATPLSASWQSNATFTFLFVHELGR
jgi:hypothetical protein